MSSCTKRMAAVMRASRVACSAEMRAASCFTSADERSSRRNSASAQRGHFAATTRTRVTWIDSHGSYHEGISSSTSSAATSVRSQTSTCVVAVHRDVRIAAAPLQRTSRGPEQAMADAARRDAGAEVVVVGVAAVEERVRAVERPGVVDDVAGAHVLDEEQRGALAVVDAAVGVVFLLDDADLVRLERVDAQVAADDVDVMEDQPLERRIEVELELRGVLHAARGEDFADDAEVCDRPSPRDLVIVERGRRCPSGRSASRWRARSRLRAARPTPARDGRRLRASRAGARGAAARTRTMDRNE